ncbi:hypothetical protein JCM8547_004063 [Rhodosporidiobolus lusitaniae]
MDEEHTHMDRLTQTQNSIEDLVRIIYSTLSYLSRKASFKQINPNYPVTQAVPGAEPDDVFEANRKELVADFVRKAKQLEFLIESLPSQGASSEDDAAAGTRENEEEFRKLEEEMKKVNEEYEEALGDAETLHRQLDQSLRGVLESRSNPSTVAVPP